MLPPVLPGAGFDAPFDMLAACHDRVRRSLVLLQRLLEHLELHGLSDVQARAAAHDVLRYFTLAAPQHHEDEERHLVPALRASADGAACGAAERLLQDHVAIRVAWAALEPPLRMIESGNLPELPPLRQAARRFVELHDAHLRLEDEIAFPLARAVVARRGRAALLAMGDEMAARRGVARTRDAA
jgi:hemerythrin-like domain-containing protein